MLTWYRHSYNHVGKLLVSGFGRVFLMDFNVILAQIRFTLAWSIFDQIE